LHFVPTSFRERSVLRESSPSWFGQGLRR
jgi:hypothetical protein